MKSHSEFKFLSKQHFGQVFVRSSYPKKQEMNDDEIYSNTKKNTIRSFTDHISNQAINMCIHCMANVKFSYTKLICLTSIINTRTPTSGDSKELMTTQAWHSEPHKCAPTHNWSNENTRKGGMEREKAKKRDRVSSRSFTKSRRLANNLHIISHILVAHIISINITISLVHKF